jgi:hypothetical protein
LPGKIFFPGKEKPHKGKKLQQKVYFCRRSGFLIPKNMLNAV